jgi:hypothetical protein
MGIRNYTTKEVSGFSFFDYTNEIIEQLFAVLPLPVVIPLIDWYDKSLSGSFKKFQ